MRSVIDTLVAASRSVAPVTSDDEPVLVPLARGGQRAARDRLVLSVARLVIQRAGAWGPCGVSLDDLVQVGMEAVIKAIDTYDYTLESRAKWVTYAGWYASAAIAAEVVRRAHLVHRTGDTPVVRQWHYVLEAYALATNQLGMSSDDAVAYASAITGLTEALVRHVLERGDDASVPMDTPSVAAQMVSHEPSPEEAVMRAEMHAVAQEVMRRCPVGKSTSLRNEIGRSVCADLGITGLDCLL